MTIDPAVLTVCRRVARSWARGRLRSHRDDLEQEAVLAVLAAVAAGKAVDERFAGVVAWRRCWLYWRADRYRAAVPFDALADDWEPAGPGPDTAAADAAWWEAALAQLTGPQREVVRLRAAEGLKLKAAAARAGVGPQWAGKLLRAAAARIRLRD